MTTHRLFLLATAAALLGACERAKAVVAEPAGSGGAGGGINQPARGGSGGPGGTYGTDFVLQLPPDSGAIDRNSAWLNARSGNGTPEICNGLDDDDNGIIDDRDVERDGVCDCLRIATLGIKGIWGTGNVFAAWLTARASDGAKDLARQVLTRELLAGFQVIVAQDISPNAIGRTYAQSEVDAMRAWIEGGGGLMTMIGYSGPEERANVNALLAPFGVSYDSQGVLSVGGGQTYPITGWVAHPTTENITMVGTDNGYAVAGQGLTVATENGIVVGKALEAKDGRIFVWGDEWISYDSEWTDHPDYQVERFWLNLLKWLTPPKECQVSLPPIL